MEFSIARGAQLLDIGMEAARNLAQLAHVLPIVSMDTTNGPLHFVNPSVLLRFVHCHPRLSSRVVSIPQIGCTSVTEAWQTPSFRELCPAVMVVVNGTHVYVGDGVMAPGVDGVAVVKELVRDSVREDSPRRFKYSHSHGSRRAARLLPSRQSTAGTVQCALRCRCLELNEGSRIAAVQHDYACDSWR